MFGSLGFPEIVMIFVVVLLLFGPKKLPDFAKTFGKAIREFRKTVNEAKSTIEEEIEKVDITRDLKEINRDIKQITTLDMDSMDVNNDNDYYKNGNGKSEKE